jgi:hypothetical protein
MSVNPKQSNAQAGLSTEELAAEQGRDLPDREAMSVIRFLEPDIGNVAIPINQSIAENYNTNDSIADASATQFVIAEQGTDASQANV